MFCVHINGNTRTQELPLRQVYFLCDSWKRWKRRQSRSRVKTRQPRKENRQDSAHYCIGRTISHHRSPFTIDQVMLKSYECYSFLSKQTRHRTDIIPFSTITYSGDIASPDDPYPISVYSSDKSVCIIFHGREELSNIFRKGRKGSVADVKKVKAPAAPKMSLYGEVLNIMIDKKSKFLNKCNQLEE